MKLRFRFDRGFAYTTALLVLAVGLAIAFLNQEALGRQKLRELDIEASTLAQTVAAPVMFADVSAARESAAAMSENPEVDAVAIYSQHGDLLASFERSGSVQSLPPDPAVRQPAFHGDTLDVVKPVAREGQTYGSVYLRLRRESLLSQLARYGPVGLLVLMTALVLAVVGAAQNALSRAYAQLEQRARDLAHANADLQGEIEQRKQAQEALVQSRKMEAIGQLTGGVAHDFNNLLMVVSGGLRMLERKDDPERRKKTMEAMHQAVERGAGLTRQLLAFARRQAIELTTVSLDERLNAMRPLLERSLRADILLDIAIQSGLPPVLTDPGQLELAVLNLCVNARDAMPKGGVITVGGRLGQDNAKVELTITDTGAGIPPEILDRIFEPYFTTKPMGQGTGLGLAQVYGFAQQSGGSVRIESQPGAGATFVLSLPISHEAIAHPVEVTLREEQGAPGRNILVVEDDNGVAETVCGMFADLGHRTIRASSAKEALNILSRGESFDFIFSDIIMPGDMSGVELAREIARRDPDLPVLLTTGYAGREDADLGRPVLRKPYDLQALNAALTQLLAGEGRAQDPPNHAPPRRSAVE